MGLRSLLDKWLGQEKDAGNSQSKTHIHAAAHRHDKIPPVVQDSCCGSCGGHGHGHDKAKAKAKADNDTGK